MAALVAKRAASPVGAKTVGPVAGGRTLHHLGVGDDHRGATWFDANERVVWLCAYRFHRSGTRADAFPYFRELMDEGRMMPVRADFARLAEDRDARAGRIAVEQAQPLLADARARPGAETHGSVLAAEVSVVVVVVDTLEETCVAIVVRGLSAEVVRLVLFGFCPQRSFTEWETGEFPARALNTEDGEMCFRILREA